MYQTINFENRDTQGPLMWFGREGFSMGSRVGTIYLLGYKGSVGSSTTNYYSVFRMFGQNASMTDASDPVVGVVDDNRSVIIKGMAVDETGIAGCLLYEVGGTAKNEVPPYHTAHGLFNNCLFSDQFGKTFMGNLGDHVDDPAFLTDLETNHPHAWLQLRGQSDRTPALIVEPGKIATNYVYRWFHGAIQFDGTNFFGTTKSAANVTNNYQFLQAGLPGNGSGITNLPAGTIVQTNFVLNTTYSNFIGRPVLLRGLATVTPASIVGMASLDIMVDQSGGLTFTRLGGTRLTTLIGSLVMPSDVEFGAHIAANANYYLTNSSTGTGNSTAIVGGTGQLTPLSKP
jgi:hypothetical protein